MSQVVPDSLVTRQFTRDLGERFPQALVILHPLFGTWQLYEVPNGSDWDAERLRAAIIHWYEFQDEDNQWWTHRGAPRIIEEDLPMWPGDWLINLLMERDHWRTGAAKDFVRAADERAKKAKESRARDRHDRNRGMADDNYRHMRDFLRGDSLAGSRKYVISKERELNG